MDIKKIQVHQYTREEISTQFARGQKDTVVEDGSYRILDDDSSFGFCSNFPCPICRRKIALFNVSQGTMNPCEDCRLKGFLTFQLKRNTQFVRWILSKLMTYYSVPVISDEARIDNKRRMLIQFPGARIQVL